MGISTNRQRICHFLQGIWLIGNGPWRYRWAEPMWMFEQLALLIERGLVLGPNRWLWMALTMGHPAIQACAQ